MGTYVDIRLDFFEKMSPKSCIDGKALNEVQACCQQTGKIGTNLSQILLISPLLEKVAKMMHRG